MAQQASTAATSRRPENGREEPQMAAAEEEGRQRRGSTWQTARRLLRFTADTDRRGFALTVATSLAGSLAEGFGLALLLPLLAIAGMNFGGGSTAGRISSAAERILAWARVQHGLWLPAVLGVFLATGAARSLLRRSQSRLVYTTVTRAELALSRRVYAQVVHARWEFLVRQRTGRLAHGLTAELRHVADSVSYLLTMLNAACLLLLYLALALKLSASMTLLVGALGCALMLAQRGSLEMTRTSGRDIAASVGEVYAATEEHLLNLKSVKAYNAEERDARLFGELCAEVARRVVGSVRHQASAAFRFEVGSLVALGLVVYLAVGVLGVQSATMLILLAIFTRVMPQLSSLQTQCHLAAAALPSYDHVLEIERECAAHAEPSAGDEPAARMELRSELRLKDIWFTYGAERDNRLGVAPRAGFVLKGVDLSIDAGAITAVIGPSGSGKSTIADLANGLLLPTQGHLLLDGCELDAGAIRPWRRSVGYVGQDTLLFHQSIRENLLWAAPHASEEEMRAALTMASADFVFDLPKGLETVVGDRGMLLSSGQRQRISLARALLRRPSLLILDEATNALDVDNEGRVLDALHEEIARARRVGTTPLTVLMIAHRPSAIRRADRVYQIEGGRLVRMGAWPALSAAE